MYNTQYMHEGNFTIKKEEPANKKSPEDTDLEVFERLKLRLKLRIIWSFLKTGLFPGGWSLTPSR